MVGWKSVNETWACRLPLNDSVNSSTAGSLKWDGVFRGWAQGDRGPPPPGSTYARGPTHLLWPALEPHHLDESLTGAQQPVPHVQQEADTGGRRGLCWRLHQTLQCTAEHSMCADVTYPAATSLNKKTLWQPAMHAATSDGCCRHMMINEWLMFSQLIELNRQIGCWMLLVVLIKTTLADSKKPLH